MKKKLLLIILLGLISLTIMGQSSGNKSMFPPPASMRDRTAETIERNTQELRQRQNLEKQLTEINKSLAAPPNYKEKYPKFTKSDKAGLFRIFPDQNCNENLIVKVEDLERCKNLPPIKGAGSRYSFRLKEMPDYLTFEKILFYIGESDFHFINGKFVVGKGLTQGIIADIGKTNLDKINSKVEEAKILSKWKLSNNELELKQQNQQLEKGININGFFFSNEMAVKQNTTYIVRSIAFSSSPSRTFWNTDILVAIQVVGEESDGSQIIIWKLINKSYAPVLKM